SQMKHQTILCTDNLIYSLSFLPSFPLSFFLFPPSPLSSPFSSPFSFFFFFPPLSFFFPFPPFLLSFFSSFPLSSPFSPLFSFLFSSLLPLFPWVRV
ncbi:hypothetical protein ACXWRW_09800, partial [Streptococcus pyogenes]